MVGPARVELATSRLSETNYRRNTIACYLTGLYPIKLQSTRGTRSARRRATVAARNAMKCNLIVLRPEAANAVGNTAINR